MDVLDSVSWVGRLSTSLAQAIARAVRGDLVGDLYKMVQPCGKHYCSAGKMVGAFALLALTACTPEPLVITRPVYIDRPRNVVQPIPAELLQPHPIAEGQPSQCPSIAAQRRAALDACNADKAAIRAIAGDKGKGDE